MTVIAANPRRYTPEELLDKDGLYELVNGQLVEKQMGFVAGECAVRISQNLQNFIDRSGGGRVGVEVTFQCFPHDPDRVRRPEVAFIGASRAAAIPAEGHVRVAPDIAVEVISPGNRINDFEHKLDDYRSAGVKLIWEVNPAVRRIRIHRLDGSTTILQESDTLTGESVLPGFSVKVSELMPSKPT